MLVSDSESDALGTLASELESPAPQNPLPEWRCLTVLVRNLDGTTHDVTIHVVAGSANTRGIVSCNRQMLLVATAGARLPST